VAARGGHERGVATGDRRLRRGAGPPARRTCSGANQARHAARPRRWSAARELAAAQQKALFLVMAKAFLLATGEQTRSWSSCRRILDGARSADGPGDAWNRPWASSRDYPDVPEKTGLDVSGENALIKARAGVERNRPAPPVADDSGARRRRSETGMPGVFSRPLGRAGHGRRPGQPRTGGWRKISDVPDEHRGGAFVVCRRAGAAERPRATSSRGKQTGRHPAGTPRRRAVLRLRPRIFLGERPGPQRNRGADPGPRRTRYSATGATRRFRETIQGHRARVVALALPALPRFATDADP